MDGFSNNRSINNSIKILNNETRTKQQDINRSKSNFFDCLNYFFILGNRSIYRKNMKTTRHKISRLTDLEYTIYEKFVFNLKVRLPIILKGLIIFIILSVIIFHLPTSL